jgi:hypothetical protein
MEPEDLLLCSSELASEVCTKPVHIPIPSFPKEHLYVKSSIYT